MAALNQEQKEQAVKQDAQEWAERQRLMRERKWRMSQTMLDKVESILRLPLVKTRLDKDGVTTVVEPVRVSVGDAARLGRTASDLAGEAVEQAKQVHEQLATPKIERAVFRLRWLEKHDENNDPGDQLVTGE